MTSPLLLALFAGVLGAIQPRINTELAGRLGNDVVAALLNFLGAVLIGTCVLAVRSGSALSLRRVRGWGVPRWTYFGGIGGALAVLSGVVAVDTIGVATFSVAFFAGQVASGLLVDALGLAPGDRRPLTAARVAGSVLALSAVVIAQVGRNAGEVSPGLVAFVVLAGVAVSFQSAGNARLARAAGDPLAATVLNSSVGTIALAAVVLGGVLAGGDTGLDWPGSPWLYLGGLLGVGIVLALAVAAAEVGVLESTLAVLAAQLVCAFVIDAIVDGASPRLGAVAGGALLLGAVWLSRRGPATT
ncbi:MAG TPA: DMT family transporter [Acidimicrobiales bacterium]|nr:DMT family transporter [Acidimicrobiales bacterium]